MSWTRLLNKYRKSNSKLGSVLILVGFGLIVFCAVTALVIDISRVYIESARVQETTEAAGMAAGRELAKYQSATGVLSSTQESEVKKAAMVFASQNGVPITSSEVVIAGDRVYVNGKKNVEYTFAKIIGFKDQDVAAKAVVKLGPNGTPTVIQQAKYNVMPFGIPHKELTEPYDISSRIINMTPSDAYTDVSQLVVGKEYVLKLGTGAIADTNSLPPGSQVLIPMGAENGVNDQWAIGYKRGYGLAVWLSGQGIPVKWLLGYRGGSFMFNYDEAALIRLGALKLSGSGSFGEYGVLTQPNLFPWIRYRIIANQTELTTIYSQTTAIINITKTPRIGVYTSPAAFGGYADPVIRVLEEAGIPFTPFFDVANSNPPKLPDGILDNFDWLHLHHENFTGGSTSQTAVPQITAGDKSGTASEGPIGGLIYVKYVAGWEGLNGVKIFFDDQQMQLTKTNTYTGCSVSADRLILNPDDWGRFEVTMIVPPKPNGTYKIYAQYLDERSNTVDYKIINSTIVPTITAVNYADNSNNVKSADYIKVVGSNFGAFQPGIVVKFNDIPQTVIKTTTFPGCDVSNFMITSDTNGNFEVLFQVVNATVTTAEVSAQIDLTSSNRVPFNITDYAGPQIEITDNIGAGNRGPALSRVYVTGSSFPSNQYGFTLKFNNQTMYINDTSLYADDSVVGDAISTTPEGKFQIWFTVPQNTLDGTYEIIVGKDTINSSPKSYCVASAQTAEISVFDKVGSMYSGVKGGQLFISGANFEPNADNIKLYLGMTELTFADTASYSDDFVYGDFRKLKASPTGNFEVSYNLPWDISEGSKMFYAYYNDTVAASAVYNITSSLPNLTFIDSSEPMTEGPAYEPLRIKGSSFPPNTSGIKIYFDNVAMNLTLPQDYSGACSITNNTDITADANGEFDVVMITPLIRPSIYFVRASNGTLNTTNYTYNLTSVSNYYTSSNSNFLTNDDAFNRNGQMYLKLISTDIDYNNIAYAYYTIQCAYHTGASKHNIGPLALTNNTNYSYTASFNWGDYAEVHNGLWQISFFIEDSSGKKYSPTKVISITGTNVATESSILSINSDLSSNDYGFWYGRTIYYKIQSPNVDPSEIKTATAKIYCKLGYDSNQSSGHYYGPYNLTNNLDGTYNGSCNLSNLNPACHLGLYKLVLYIEDMHGRKFESSKEFCLFTSTVNPTMIVSNNTNYSEPNSGSYAVNYYRNGSAYFVFNASPPMSSPRLNYNSISQAYFYVRSSANSNLSNAYTSPSYNLNNCMNGTFTGEINLSSVGVRANDRYFKIYVYVRDTSNINTGTISSSTLNVVNTQPSSGLTFNDNKNGIDNCVCNNSSLINSMGNIANYYKDMTYKKAYNFIQAGMERPINTDKSDLNKKSQSYAYKYYDDEMRKDMELLSKKNGTELFMKYRVNNLLKNNADAAAKKYAKKLYTDKLKAQAVNKAAGPVDLKKNKESKLNEIITNMIKPDYAWAAQYPGKYDVVHTIRNWVVNGGYLFAMCYATETFDNVLAMDNQGTPIGTMTYNNVTGKYDIPSGNFNLTMAFKNFTPRYPDPGGNVSLDDVDYGNFTLLAQDPNADKYKRNLAVMQDHVTTLQGFSGATTAFKKACVKDTTGPNNTAVYTLGSIDSGTVKYVASEYGKGWFSYLGGHDPRLVETYRLVLDNILVGSLSSTAVTPTNVLSYGALDWNMTPDEALDPNEYINAMKYGYPPALGGSIVTNYPGDLAGDPLTHSVPHCYEEESNSCVNYLYNLDSRTPRVDEQPLPRTYKNYVDGSSRFVLVPLVTPYASNGNLLCTKAANISKRPKFIYEIVDHDNVRIKRYALFYLSGNTASENADPLLNEVGATRYGEIRGKFVGYLN
ncbi:MAG: Tad domain-containing protein [Candidatus Wallbacteria bacterium]